MQGHAKERGARVEKATKTICRENPVNPEEKWIRLQEIGLSQILAIPVALMLGVMFQLNSMLLGIIPLVLLSSGYACLKFGHDKRREIHDQENDTGSLKEQP